jgi:hypothetical protein
MSDQPIISDDKQWIWDGTAWRPNDQPATAMDVEQGIWQQREPAAFEGSDDDIPEPANTYGLNDNCYYVTAAVLANTTVDALISATETMQNRGGAYVPEITALFSAANLVATYASFSTLDAMIEHMHNTSGGFDQRFGLYFDRGATAHMVVAEWNATDQEFAFTDYQSNPSGSDAGADVATGVLFHLYGPQ